ncbi:hypothetical protein [Amycolatopsis sp.]|uniref:hypothetical protein n=1 Tax=Amycolatopsis sp. TaxID=37632 RepID=UPI00260A5F02|nr:hypothetical protein [Amycolatopsis sp.]
MMKRDMIDDLVDIIYPLPDPLKADANDNEEAGYDAWRRDVEDQRNAFEQNRRHTVENSEDYFDPLLAEITQARREIREAAARMRLLVAYGREFVRPSPYQLKDLADATSMSISGARGAYDDEEIATVARRIGRQPRTRALPSPAITD